MTQEAFDKDVHKIASYTINVIKIERYRRRKQTIDEWMERDRKTQEKYDKLLLKKFIALNVSLEQK